MISTNINNKDRKRRVLVAPLDWGLGHATRCVPIIHALIAQGFEVLLAGEKATAALLQEEFPTLEILLLTGYNVQYSNSKFGFVWKMLAQIPSILKAIKKEQHWLQNIIELNKIDIVVSDNRYGLHSAKAKTIFITHQLQIQTGNSFLNNIIQKINYKYINKFDACWVPDLVGENNLAAALSHPKLLPKNPVQYIGILSRLQKLIAEKNIDVVIILSGPEPQRTLFENIILQQIKNSTLKIVLARGLPNEKEALEIENINVKIVNHLPSGEISLLLQSAKTVIARSGYSTVMDMAALQQAAIFVPTPGQTEQEYLAKYLSDKNYCTAASQASFNLQAEVEKIINSNLEPYPTNDFALLANAVSAL